MQKGNGYWVCVPGLGNPDPPVRSMRSTAEENVGQSDLIFRVLPFR